MNKFKCHDACANAVNQVKKVQITKLACTLRFLTQKPQNYRNHLINLKNY